MQIGQAVGEIATLEALSAYKSLKKDQGPLVFKRAYIPSTDDRAPTEYLQAVPLRSLGWWQTILRFFGHSDYKDATITRLMAQAQARLEEFKPNIIEYDSIVSAIVHVNKALNRSRVSKVLGVFSRSVPSAVPIITPSLAHIRQANGSQKSQSPASPQSPPSSQVQQPASPVVPPSQEEAKRKDTLTHPASVLRISGQPKGNRESSLPVLL